ncbi:MAG: STAS domain-containing protein [Longimicrobiales bacterium]
MIGARRCGIIHSSGMDEHEPSREIHAVDVVVEGNVLTAKIVGTTVERHRAAVILEKTKEAIDLHAGDLSHVVVDFGDVNFINSSGLGACVQLARHAQDKGLKPIAYRLKDPMIKIFKTVKADHIYRLVHTGIELTKVLEE